MSLARAASAPAWREAKAARRALPDGIFYCFCPRRYKDGFLVKITRHDRVQPFSKGNGGVSTDADYRIQHGKTPVQI